MKNKKGFTLVELLAVIVLLGIISAASITGLLSTRKNANIKLAKKLEQTLTQVGDEIYPYESIQESSTFMSTFRGLNNGDKRKITLDSLKNANFLKNLVKEGGRYKLVSPVSNKVTCDGFIIVTKENNAPKYQGYVKCNDLYTTEIKNNAGVVISSYDIESTNAEVTLTAD